MVACPILVQSRLEVRRLVAKRVRRTTTSVAALSTTTFVVATVSVDRALTPKGQIAEGNETGCPTTSEVIAVGPS